MKHIRNEVYLASRARWATAGACLFLSAMLPRCAAGDDDPSAPLASPGDDSDGATGGVESGITLPDAPASPTTGEDAMASDFDAQTSHDSGPPSRDAAPAADASDDPDAGLGAGPDTGVSTVDAQGGAPDGAVSPSCTGVTAWVEGTTAQTVANFGEKYTCITPAWCSLTGVSAVLAYEPGTGSAWQLAWKDDGPCTEDGGTP